VPLLQPFAQRGAQVLDLFLVHRQIRMAGHAELRELGDLAAGEQVAQVGPDQAGNRHEQGLPRTLGLRHAHEARQDARHLDDGDLVLAAEGVLAGEPHDEVERLVGHLRKRVRRVEPDRHQQRLHFTDEKVLHPAALRGGALAVRHQLDALLLEQRQQFVVVDGVLLGHQFVHLGRELVVGLCGVEAALLVRLGGRDVGRDPYLEELVEVAGHDAQVTQALQQRNVRAAGPVHHPLVEGEDAVIAVEKGMPVAVGRGAHGP